MKAKGHRSPVSVVDSATSDRAGERVAESRVTSSWEGHSLMPPKGVWLGWASMIARRMFLRAGVDLAGASAVTCWG